MHITDIHIENFRLFKEFDITLSAKTTEACHFSL